MLLSKALSDHPQINFLFSLDAWEKQADGMPILKPELARSVRALLLTAQEAQRLLVYLTEKFRIDLAQLYPELQYYHQDSISLPLSIS